MIKKGINTMKTLLVLALLAVCTPAWAISEANIDKLADAIYLAEGGDKAVKPYGILSIP